MYLLFTPEEVHKGGDQLFPVRFTVAAAHLTVELHRGAGGGNLVADPLVPAVGLAAAVLPVGILDAPGLPGAPGEIDPGVRGNYVAADVRHQGTDAEADGAGDAGGFGEPPVIMDRGIQGHETAHAGAADAGVGPVGEGPVLPVDHGLQLVDHPADGRLARAADLAEDPEDLEFDRRQRQFCIIERRRT